MDTTDTSSSLRRKLFLVSRKSQVTPAFVQNDSIGQMSDDGTHFSSDDVESSFQLISRALYITGVFLPLCQRSGDESILTRCIKKFYETVVDVLSCYMAISLGSRLILRQSDAPGVMIFVSFTIAVGIRFVMRRRPENIVLAIAKMVQLYNETVGTDYKRFKIITVIGVCISVLVVVTILLSECLLQGLDVYIAEQAKYYFFYVNIKSIYLRWIIIVLVFLCSILQYIYTITVTNLAFLFCSCIYMILNEIVCKSKMRLQTSIHDNSLSKAILEFHSLASRIILVVAGIEKAFSLIVFLVYIYLLSTVYSLLTMMYGNSEYSVKNIFFFIMVSATFLVLTFFASKIPETAAEVKLILREIIQIKNLTAEVSSSSLTSTLMLAYTFPSDVTLTGWGMFNLNKGFILTALGVTVTYGIILAQTTGNKYLR